MDNRLIIVQSEGRESFDLAFKLLFAYGYTVGKPRTVTHYVENPEKGLVLYDEIGPPNAIKLPVALECQQAADLAWAWLQSKNDKDYFDWIDHDGSNSHGFKVYNEDWNRVGGFGGLLAVLPVWAWHGK